MSIRILTMVWDSGAYDGGTLLVLLAMADHADDTGGSIFPTIRTLARKARLSPRQVHTCIAQLKTDQMIWPDRDAVTPYNGAVPYRINVAKLRQMLADEEAKSDGEGSAITAGGGMQPASGGGMKPTSDNNHHSKPPVKSGRTKVRTASEPSGRKRIGDWRPGAEERSAATAYWTARGRYDLVGVVADQIDRFVAHHKAHGKPMADWPAAWQTWYSNALRDRTVTAGQSAPPPMDTTLWVTRLVYFHHGCEVDEVAKGYWAAKWGPEPGQAGCLVPAEAIAAYAAQHRPRATGTGQ